MSGHMENDVTVNGYDSRPDVCVEILRFCVDDGVLKVSSQIEQLVYEPPDVCAYRISQLDGNDPAGICHSTSWRYETTGPFHTAAVILTYAALPCPLLPDAKPVEAAPVMASGDPLRPTPPGLHQHHVVAHAMRHLVGLAESDPAIMVAANQESADGLWTKIRNRVETIDVQAACEEHVHDPDEVHSHSHEPST